MESRGDDEVEATDAAAAGMFVSMAVSPTTAASKDSKCAISLTFQKTTSSSSSCCGQTHHTVLNKLLLQQVPPQQQVSRTVDELRSVFLLLLLLLQLLFTHSLTHFVYQRWSKFSQPQKTDTHTQKNKKILSHPKTNKFWAFHKIPPQPHTKKRKIPYQKQQKNSPAPPQNKTKTQYPIPEN